MSDISGSLYKVSESGVSGPSTISGFYSSATLNQTEDWKNEKQSVFDARAKKIADDKNFSVKLTSAQEERILEIWNSSPNDPPSLMELTKKIFSGDFDGRSAEGKAIKNFLASRSLKAPTVSDFKKIREVQKGRTQLTDEQKEFIKRNYDSMKPVEIAKVIFNNLKLSHVHWECRVVMGYIAGLKIEQGVPAEEAEEEIATYSPPKVINTILDRLKRYLPTFRELSEDKLTPRQKSDIMAVGRYLGSYRFIYTMNNIEDPKKRQLLESSFLSYVCDKNDLTAEETDSYLNLALDVLNLANTQEQIDKLTELMRSSTDDPESKKISMSLAESIHNAQTEYNQNKMRQQKLANDLQGKRSERIDSQLRNNASILNLVALWRDDNERSKLVKYAEELESKLKGEVTRLSEMDDLRCKIFGLHQDELLQQ